MGKPKTEISSTSRILNENKIKQDEQEKSQINAVPQKPLEKELPKATPVVKREVPQVKYREVVYLGISEEAERIGAVTGAQYIFRKDRYGMPVSTQVDERDYPAIIAEKGKGCARRSPQILFMSKLEWDLELEQARVANR